MSAGTERPLDEVKVARTASIKEALARLDEAGTGALVVVDAEGRLYGLLTDGDVRRAILRGVEFDRSCGSIASRDPIVARGTISAADALHTMIRHDINHLLLLDEDGTPERLLLRNSLTLENDLDETARKRRESVSIDSSASITDALARLDKAGTGALVVVDEKGGLFGLLTDGDIRRAILRGVQLEEPCGDIASRDPIVVRGSITAAEALHIMAERDINHLLLLDERGQFAELLLRRDLIEDDPADLAAVVMAGGFGTRLYPLTLQTPKPMLPVGDRPLLERMLRQLRRSGIKDVSLTTHYMPESIERHFGDGEGFGVKLRYSNEDQPLGTAGGLRLMSRPSGPLLVINGDVLTGLSFQDMLDYHRKHGAELTVGVRRYSVDVPFGVVECDDVRVVALKEKPSLALFINAGIYLLEPTAYDSIPAEGRFDMTDLIGMLLGEGRPVVSFPILEYWHDIGQHADYQQAQADARDGLI